MQPFADCLAGVAKAQLDFPANPKFELKNRRGITFPGDLLGRLFGPALSDRTGAR
jgi:hypothetical protein